MVGFGSYLKDYLINNNISQSEFANRLNITQKHMNEMLNEKTDITLDMVASISRLTNIPIDFIVNSENRKIITKELISKYKDKEKINKILKRDFYMDELLKLNWINFKDISDPIQNYMDLLEFLNVRNFEALDRIKEKTLIDSNKKNINKLILWIARCDEISKKQNVKEYIPINFLFLMEDLKKEAYKKEMNLVNIQHLLNNYGIYFVTEKMLSKIDVRGCFKVKGKNPAIYITQNYKAKDSLFFEIFHELGHCKSDYNEAKSKVIVEGNDLQESRADNFALNAMIDEKLWDENFEKLISEKDMLEFSKKNKIPPSFIVGRLAKIGKIKYNSKYYNKYCSI